MSEKHNPHPLEGQIPSQQQSLGDVQVEGHDNTVNVLQGQVITLTQTKITQISADKIKKDQLITASPYKGLKSFEPEDSDRFFGRDQFLKELVSELEQTNFILLLGASGSGKSSVVRAGLIPLLQKVRIDDFDSLIFTPDLDPFESLYRNLPRRYKQSETQIARVSSDDTLSQVVNQLKPQKSFWLIFIDQFEELFTLSEPEKRDHFIASLVKLSQERIADPSIRIVATMRADFLDQLDPFPANQLASLTQKHRPLITQMHLDELRLAIEQPAAHHGIVFEPGLVEIIIKQVQGQAGYLPLLQYTLNLLWEQESQRNEFAQERTLRTQTYLNLGGVRGALKQHVDQIYGSLSEPEQIATQRIFLKLVEIGGDELAGTEWKPVRRRAARSEFNDETEQRVLTQLINNNLLVSDASEVGSEQQSPRPGATVEIAHEILLTSWQTLKTWIEENRQTIALRNRLYDDVRLWIRENKRDDDLWSGIKLVRVIELSDNPTFIQVLGGFNSEAIDFINASKELLNRKIYEQKQREHEQRQRELKLRIDTGDERRASLLELLQSCTVKLSIPGQVESSTGFLVAPGKILTCDSRIAEAGNQRIQVDWQEQKNPDEATVDRVFPSHNLAILKLASNSSHPCVYLDETFSVNDPVCTYGYTDEFVKGGYGRGKFQKQTGKKRDIIEFGTYQDSLKLQSSPLLNLQTSKVCGVVQSTHSEERSERDRDIVTVGKAISAATILATVDGLKQEQKAFHKKDPCWSKLFPPRCKPRTVALASLGVTALVMLIRSFQIFQPFELGFYDILMQSRFNPPKPSNRFLIVTITRQDAEAQEKRGEAISYSLSNVTLTKLLKKVGTLQPIAIGLDIYREQTFNSKQSKDLKNLFQRSDLFAVCKKETELESDGVAAPPGVGSERVGFSDFSQDEDRILRRLLLAFNLGSSRCSSTKSFSLLLAERYLQNSPEKIQVTADTSNGCQIRFSNGVTLPNLRPNTGGYQGYVSSKNAFFEGCQILLNYRNEQASQPYETVTLEDFLKADFPVQKYNNRIVLIGIDRFDGISDNVRTPYDQELDQYTMGVVVQAHMIDQIIDAASRSNALIWVLPSRIDVFLILIAALIGGGAGWWVQSPRQLGMIIVISGGSVLVISFFIFQFGGWVPLMPQFLALSATSSYVFWSNMRLRSVASAKPVKQ